MADRDITWMWRIMEIRKNPELATHEDIINMTDDILLGIYTKNSNTSFADVGKNFINGQTESSESVKNVT